ncbi:MAG: hypothetical protein U5K74_09375 [Gemmatimonadaceae bacterium]|nr:hypothetical protein [Gemmatimonadaceae bacterium]
MPAPRVEQRAIDREVFMWHSSRRSSAARSTFAMKGVGNLPLDQAVAILAEHWGDPHGIIRG